MKPRHTHYENAQGHLVLRAEIVGRESGPPPILIGWHDITTGEFLGNYRRDSLDVEPETSGPMFRKQAV